MIPKVETCIYALEQGVEGVVILDGKVPHAVLLELLTDHGAGTLMHTPLTIVSFRAGLSVGTLSKSATVIPGRRAAANPKSLQQRRRLALNSGSARFRARPGMADRNDERPPTHGPASFADSLPSLPRQLPCLWPRKRRPNDVVQSHQLPDGSRGASKARQCRYTRLVSPRSRTMPARSLDGPLDADMVYLHPRTPSVYGARRCRKTGKPNSSSATAISKLPTRAVVRRTNRPISALKPVRFPERTGRQPRRRGRLR